jgi:hypothetical protein
MDVASKDIKDGLVIRKCDVCGDDKMKLFFGLWQHDMLFNNGMGDVRYDKKGRVRAFSALEDPIAKIELGFHKDMHDKGLQTFNQDQVLHFRERLAVEGNTPNLRRKIIETRNSNVAKEK